MTKVAAMIRSLVIFAVGVFGFYAATAATLLAGGTNDHIRSRR